jgi:hypothetical protein
MTWVASAIVGGAVIGGIASDRAASKAAKAQAKSSDAAIEFERESRDLALELQRPAREASYAATAALMDLAGLSRGTVKPKPVIGEKPLPPTLRNLAGSGSILRQAAGAVIGHQNDLAAYEAAQAEPPAPNLADFPTYKFQADPGYEFRLNEGMRALERSAAAQGGLLSGGFGRKALRYAQDYASNEYQNVYNRIASIAGFGQVATNNSTGIIMGASGNIGNAMMNAGEARASGYIAQGNAWSNALNQIGQGAGYFNFGGGGTPRAVAMNYTGPQFGGYA